MSIRTRLVGSALALGGLLGQSPEVAGQARSADDGVLPTGSSESGLAFIENRGQWPNSVRYAARCGSMQASVAPEGIGLHGMRSSNTGPLAYGVFLRFVGASSEVELAGEEPLPGIYSFFRGRDAAKWVRGAPSFARVRWRGLYDGIDVVLREGDGGLEYDLHLAPGADLSQVVMRCEGARSARMDGRCLALDTGAGPLRQSIGRSWQQSVDGRRAAVQARFRVLDDDTFGFEVLGRDLGQALTIDPGLAWSTYLGSALPRDDLGHAVAAGRDGTVTVVGQAGWMDFPMTPSAYQHAMSNAAGDWFVTRLRSADGQLVYSSVIGSYSDDRAHALAVDASGRAVVAGTVRGGDFPTTPASFNPTAITGLGTKSIVLRLNPTGTDLEYSTYIQGTSNQGVHDYDNFNASGVAIDESTGAVIVAGWGVGLLPATPGAFDPVGGGTQNSSGFIARLDPTGSSLEWASFLGGTRLDEVLGVALDRQGRVAVTGRTTSRDFPVTPGVFQSEFAPPPSGSGGLPVWTSFLTVFEPDGASLARSSYFGGTGWGDVTYGNAIAAVHQGGWTLAGVAANNNGGRPVAFPTTPGAWQELPAASGDGWVARLPADLSTLVYSTLLGGSAPDGMTALAVDHSGAATAFGWAGAGFPTTQGAFQLALAGISDGALVRLNPRGTKLLYSSLLGGADYDFPQGVAINPSGLTTAVGSTWSHDFPTTPGSIGPTYTGGQSEVFVTTLDLVPAGVESFGRSTASCLGPVQLNVLELPQAGASSFGFYVSQAPPSSQGWLVAGTAGTTPLVLAGASFLLDPAQRLVRLPLATDTDGWSEVPFPLSGLLPGMRLDVQALIRNTSACSGLGRLSATNGVRVTVQ